MLIVVESLIGNFTKTNWLLANCHSFDGLLYQDDESPRYCLLPHIPRHVIYFLQQKPWRDDQRIYHWNSSDNSLALAITYQDAQSVQRCSSIAIETRLCSATLLEKLIYLVFFLVLNSQDIICMVTSITQAESSVWKSAFWQKYRCWINCTLVLQDTKASQTTDCPWIYVAKTRDWKIIKSVEDRLDSLQEVEDGQTLGNLWTSYKKISHERRSLMSSTHDNRKRY